MDARLDASVRLLQLRQIQIESRLQTEQLVVILSEIDHAGERPFG